MSHNYLNLSIVSLTGNKRRSLMAKRNIIFKPVKSIGKLFMFLFIKFPLLVLAYSVKLPLKIFWFSILAFVYITFYTCLWILCVGFSYTIFDFIHTKNSR